MHVLLNAKPYAEATQRFKERRLLNTSKSGGNNKANRENKQEETAEGHRGVQFCVETEKMVVSSYVTCVAYLRVRT